MIARFPVLTAFLLMSCTEPEPSKADILTDSTPEDDKGQLRQLPKQVEGSDVATEVNDAADAPPSQRYLMFDFPDGVRSYRGKILGDLSRYRPEPMSESLEILRSCGAVEPEARGFMSHHNHIFIKSSTNDVAIAECFKLSTATNFNVGVGPDPLAQRGLFQFDTSKFEHLENNPEWEERR